MARRTGMQAELDALRKELEELRAAATAKVGEAAAAAQEAVSDAVDEHGAELKKAVDGYLEDAEDMMTDHPLLAVGGALVIGILIGRLTAR